MFSTSSTPGIIRRSLLGAALLAPLLARADALGAAALGGLVENVLLLLYVLTLGLVVLSYLRPASAGLHSAQLALGGLCFWLGGLVLHISRETLQGGSGSLDTVDSLFVVLLMVGAWLNGVRRARTAPPGWLATLGAVVAAFALHCLVLFLIGGRDSYYTFSPNDGLYPAQPSVQGFGVELLASMGAWGVVRWQLGAAAQAVFGQLRWRASLLAVAVFGSYCLLFLYAQRLEEWQAQHYAAWLGQGIVMAGIAAALAQRIFSLPKAPVAADPSNAA
jgi:hypothetical protein